MAGSRPRQRPASTNGANTRGLGELDGLMGRIDGLRLRERTAEAGGELDVFIHPWGPAGEAFGVERLRPTVAEMEQIPAALMASSRKHFDREVLWRGEADLYAEIMAREPWHPYAVEPEPTHMPWFLIDGAFDVYFNQFGYDPWWRLGNLAAEPLETILTRFEINDTPGLRTVYTVTPQELAQRHGDPAGQKAYSDIDDLLALYVARHCAGTISG